MIIRLNEDTIFHNLKLDFGRDLKTHIFAQFHRNENKCEMCEFTFIVKDADVALLF